MIIITSGLNIRKRRCIQSMKSYVHANQNYFITKRFAMNIVSVLCITFIALILFLHDIIVKHIFGITYLDDIMTSLMSKYINLLRNKHIKLHEIISNRYHLINLQFRVISYRI